ncbi:hypothetical protein LZZ85_18510 [Terrimonas sp. NA20]|uniref:Uncharacterized protein n=1 Tax=Terrimonas ginsenosidimutans TaxID=2908004 RepID=A0ABS9KVG4_9BACT|nr:hypothetical protein [Terrimonas ginsenosidimutans]MCG2616298.1 hypothetical protein [Terrimonas ginsenosidimutans]
MLSTIKIKQLEFESDNWKNSLKFMTEGNVRMKARLSELLQHKLSQELLDETEDFQNKFIDQDDLIRVLRNAIAGFESSIKLESVGRLTIDAVLASRKSITSRIEAAKTKFDDLANRFNRFALHNF